MTLRDRLAVFARAAVGLFSEQSATAAWGLLGGSFPGGIGDAPRRGTRERLEAFGDLPWLHAVADRVATAFSAVEWQLFVARRGGRAQRMKAWQRAPAPARRSYLKAAREAGELTQIEDHLLLNVLHDANEFQTGEQFRRTMMLGYDLAGDAFLLKERNGLGAPVALWPIPAHWILATPTPTRRSYRVAFRGWHGEIPDTEFVWVNNPNPAFPYGRGVGMAQALADELETDEYTAKHVRQTFLNQARPDFLIWPKDGSGGESNVTRLQEEWRAQHQGFWRIAKPRFLTREVGVYEFGEPAHFRNMTLVPLREFQRDIIRQCHDPETEALTRRGWVPGLDLQEDDEVATWDEEKRTLAWMVPSALVRREHHGLMHYWVNDRVDVAVTPDHRMYVWSPRGMEFITSEMARTRLEQHWRITCPDTTPGRAVVEIPFVAYRRAHRATRRPADGAAAYRVNAVAFARWLGYWLAEGYMSKAPGRYLLECSQTTPAECAEPVGIAADMVAATRAMADAGFGRFTVRRAKRLTRGGRAAWLIQFSDKSLWSWIMAHCGTRSTTKHIPREAMTWTREAQTALLEAMIDGDGHRVRPGYAWIGTSSRQLADDIQHLAVLLGRHATLRVPIRTEKSREHHQPYIVTIDDRHTTVVTPRACTVKPYSGPVWCVELDGRAFVTRRRGRVALHGNCWGVPPVILGIIEPGQSRATVGVEKAVFGEFVLTPRLEMFRSVLQERLVPEYDDRLILDYVSPVEEDAEARAAAVAAAPWALSADEHRARMGLPEKEDGSGTVHMVPINLQAVETLAAPPPKPAPPAPSEEEGEDGKGLARLTTDELLDLRKLTSKMEGR